MIVLLTYATATYNSAMIHAKLRDIANLMLRYAPSLDIARKNKKYVYRRCTWYKYVKLIHV